MAGFIIAAARALVLAGIALSAIASMFEATNAVAVYTNHSVFVSGLMMVAAAVLLNPLFCFIATFGLVRYADAPLAVALALTLPACLAWCFVAGRGLVRATSR